ncbi:MAG: S41 family peptidase [bacterium]|nr:S41 family peptidase [bacterium]
MFALIKKKLALISIIGFLLLAFGLGVWFGKSQVVYPILPPGEVDFSLFWETWAKLQEKYVDKEKFDTQKMIYGAISGMVKSLDDPYTVFMEPEVNKIFTEDVKGSFEGIGMEIGIKKDQLQVIAPLEGTPAQKAGLKAGDKILKINDKSTVDMTVEEAVKIIRGQKGTEVVLSIFRDGWKEAKDFKIVRDVIFVPSLKWELKEGNIAYLQLYQFSEQADFDFKKAAVEILDSKADRIILDLRNNPGGYLEVSQNIASWFLEKDKIVTIEDFGKNKEQKFYKAQGNEKLLAYPIVILMNKGSASASEILAGALRDNRDIKLIGETSFGKGSVQEMEKLRGGSSLKVTVAKWLTPKGYSISEKGLEPDIKVEITAEDEKAEKDSQLEKAIEIVKGMR